jgi:hypothetical protein
MKRYPMGLGASRRGAVRLVLVVLCLTSSSCYRYASIERRSAPALNAQIERSDSQKLYLTLEDGSEETVSRTEVVDISHPGKIRLVTGLALAAAGASLLVYTYGFFKPCRGSRPGDECADVFLSLPLIGTGLTGVIAGGSLATAGGIAYLDSVTAAAPPPDTPSIRTMRRAVPRMTCSFCSGQTTPIADALSNMALHLSIPPQGHRCRIETTTWRRACR